MQNNNTISKKHIFILLTTTLILLLTISIISFYFAYNYGKEKCIEKTTNVAIEETINSTQEKTDKRTLIVLISLDGFGSNLLNEKDAPYIYSLLDKSSYTLEAKTIAQSETQPSHTSMLTGLNAENHGVSYNSVDEETPPFILPTILDFAMEADYDYFTFMNKEKLIHILGAKKGNNLLFLNQMSEEVIDDIDDLLEPTNGDVFAFIHFRDLDSIGHKYGWGSDEQMAAFTKLDTNVMNMIMDLNSEFDEYEQYFIITADHGGEGKQHGNGCPNCRTIPIIIYSENTSTQYSLDLKTHNYKIYDLTCIVLDIMRFTPEQRLDCYRKD